MSTFYYRGGSVYSVPIEVEGLDEIDVEIAAQPPLESVTALEIQETTNKVDWVGHTGQSGSWAATSTLLEAAAGRRFLRLHLDGPALATPPHRVWWGVRPRWPRTQRDGGGGA